MSSVTRLVAACAAVLLVAFCASSGVDLGVQAQDTLGGPLSTATIYDYLQTNGSFFVYSSIISRFDNLWPLLAGFPEGTIVSLEEPGSPLRRRGFLWEGSKDPALRRRQASDETTYDANYTVLAPTDQALAEFFSTIPSITVLQEPYGNPFWSLVSAYHILNGTFELAQLGEGDLPTLTKYANVNLTSTGSGETLNMTVNSAFVLENEPVRCGNGLVYPVNKFIWPGDYTELAGISLGVNEVVSLAEDVNGLSSSE